MEKRPPNALFSAIQDYNSPKEKTSLINWRLSIMDIAFLGDSITLGYALDDNNDRFSTLVCKRLGHNEINHGITGTLMAQASMNRNDGKDFVHRLPLIHDADVAVIFGGTNDYFWSDRPIYPPKSLETREKEVSLDYFSNALKAICDDCNEKRHGKLTLFVTPYPHHGTGNYFGGATWNTSSKHDTSERNFNGHVLQDYVDEIERAATAAGFPVLNLHQVIGFDWRKHTIDGCHPNPLGHQWLADVITTKLKELLP
jgi:lysophospholipase L1-like esterase